ncbi:DcaP family trimeric outer membrane transporter [Phaeocystidibacter luteus]|uniref:Porin n=1 Tax=Phaeocystidibacter luteus TaxID=911197 RepID=A0A6N6RFT8_9FLAO|nr:DcaP family trimeric outer membrane transporter [Phaeocystidibacter luteus]KAB2808618.1 hypothetical protein F8C67_10040 [Phaeocystidibacter luteus]
MTTLIFSSALRAQSHYNNLRGAPEDSARATELNFPGAIKIPDSDFYLKFGGYFRIDAIYDFNGSGSRNQLLMSQIYADNVPEAAFGPFFNMHVRETRFNFDIRRKTGLGRDMKFFIEFDFFDESLGAGQPRLRHAFVKYGGWTVGQTWTNLSDLRVFPFIMDFSAGDALFGGRSVQVRYEHDFTPHWQLGVSAEMPGLNGIFNPDTVVGRAMPVMPVGSIRITNNRDNGMISMGAQLEQIRWYGLGVGPTSTALGWGVVLNGRQGLTSDLFVTWHMSYNRGITDQILIFAGTDQGAVIRPDGSFVLEDAITFAVGAGYHITPKLQTNFALARTDRGELDFRSDHTLDNGYMGHYNLIYALDSHVMTGIEYQWGNIQNVDLATGSASRIQAMLKYSF